jgi:hypothetical protein
MLVDDWFPFFDVGKTPDEVDRAFGRMGRPPGLRSVPRGTFPAVNLYQQDDAIVLTAEAPGVDPDPLELTVVNDSVTLKGRREEKDIPDNNRSYRRERPTPSSGNWTGPASPDSSHLFSGGGPIDVCGSRRSTSADRPTAFGRATQRASERSGVYGVGRGVIDSPSGKAPWAGRRIEAMREWQSLSHVRRECKCHVVIIPRCRRECCMEGSDAESGRSCGSVG